MVQGSSALFLLGQLIKRLAEKKVISREDIHIILDGSVKMTENFPDEPVANEIQETLTGFLRLLEKPPSSGLRDEDPPPDA